MTKIHLVGLVCALIFTSNIYAERVCTVVHQDGQFGDKQIRIYKQISGKKELVAKEKGAHELRSMIDALRVVEQLKSLGVCSNIEVTGPEAQ